MSDESGSIFPKGQIRIRFLFEGRFRILILSTFIEVSRNVRVDENNLFVTYFRFATSVNVNECLTQIEFPISLQTCLSCSLLPFDISVIVLDLDLDLGLEFVEEEEEGAGQYNHRLPEHRGQRLSNFDLQL